MISIVIPCGPTHVSFLYNLLHEFMKQTLYPNEVVISISESDRVDQKEFIRLENLKLPFSIILIKNLDKKTPGENRQIGSDHCNYDYIIYQDADDIPHKQRIEIMNYVFQNFNANHITHLTTHHAKGINTIHKLENIKPHKWNVRSSIKGSPTTAGNIGVHRKVFENVRWTNHKVGEDTRFTDAVLSKYDNCYRVGVTLHFYRTQYSTSHK